MRVPRVVAFVAAALIGTGAAVAGVATTVSAAPAGTVLCDQYASTTSPDGRYIVQNNRWGSTTQQCVTVTNGGFTLSTSNANVPTNGAPASYPSIYWGCHYGNCTPGFNPIQASSSAFAGISSSVSMSYVNSGQWNASYDVWFDPTPRRDGQNTGAELMVWMNKLGSIQPIGSRVATVTLAGGTWDVWFGNIGWNVVSYVRTSPTTTLNSSVSTFYDDMVSRGYAQRSWYLTSIQAGFEPWTNGTGLAVTNFAVSTGGGTGPTTPPVTTPPPNPAGGCTATVQVVNQWNGGYTADVVVRNNGGSTTRNWSVTWTGSVTNAWNATVTQSGSNVTARNVSYNGTLAPSGSTTFGFQSTGTPPTGSPTCTSSV
jgi:hypothetical protein